MCGIAGVFGDRDEATVREMIAALVHRGPDDGHVVSGEDFAVGARRLSIIDPERGRQPMCNETATVWVAQNGEIYNFPELKRELIEAGHRFRTRCDTEVLAHLYEQSGLKLSDRIDGMFAIALWDKRLRRGLLVRDRIGKKPLYYTRRGSQLYFASEIKALLRIPGFERRLNLEALHHYLSYKHVPWPLSIFEGVSILPPGHRLVYQKGSEPQVEPFWAVDFAEPLPPEELQEEALVDRLLDLLRSSVRRRLVSDVPIGFFLSGGIDSGLITALGAELSPEPVRTFTLVYSSESTTRGKEQDRRFAQELARRYATKHLEQRIDAASLPEELPRIIRCFDEPFAGVFSSFFLSRLIAQHVKVTLCGDGADELFGSYLSHRLAGPMDEYVRSRERGEAPPAALLPFEGRPGFLEALAEPEDWRWRSKLLVFSEEEKRGLYTPDVARALEGASTVEQMRSHFQSGTARDPLNRVLEAELKHIFVDQVLTYADRLSMAHSLEVRSPFLDHDLVSFVARIPGSLKIRRGVTKYILKRAALRYLPEEMVHRPKEGFIMPLTQWMLGDLEDYVRSTLSPESLRRHGIFDPAAVGQLIDRLYVESSDYTVVNRVLTLLAFQLWYDLYMGASA